jgi:hypothetical protein
MTYTWHEPCKGEMKNLYKTLVQKLEGKKPFERPNRRWEDNIKVDFRKRVLRVCIGFMWIRTGEWRLALVNTVMNLWVLYEGNLFPSQAYY